MNPATQTERALYRAVYVCVCASVLLALGFSYTRPGRWLEDGTFDVRARWTAARSKADPRVVIVDVDNASYSVLQEKLGRWPWPRTVWTEVIRYVSKGQPSAIAVDIVFGGEDKSGAKVDAEFANVLRTSGKTALAFAFLSTHVSSDDPTAEKERERILQQQGIGEGFGPELTQQEWVPNIPLPQLAEAAAGLGSINSTPDQTGTIRRTPLQFRFGDRGYLTLGARAVKIAAGSSRGFEWHQRAGIFDHNFVTRDEKQIPLDDDGKLVLLYRGDSLHAFPRVPIWEVICSIYREQCPNALHFYPAEYFRDKVVVLGASAAASYEPRPTPLDPQAPGFMVHATAIENLLSGEALRLAPFWLAPLLVALLAASAGALQLRVRSFMSRMTMLVAVLILYIGGSALAFHRWHFDVPVFAPLSALVLAYGSGSTARYATTGRQLRQTRGVLERYVAPQLVNYVMSNLDSMQLKGNKRELTILISDVRNFTTMTEKADPAELIALLDDYFAAMTEIIFKYNGIVDKFIGDGILAYWGAFTPERNHAMEACQAALEMIEQVKVLNERWRPQGKPEIAIGIGVNTGKVVFGNIGKGKKLEFTVIGDAVNLAARLEGLNKEFHTSIVIGEETQRRLAGNMDVRCLGGVKVKGKTIETQVYELRGRAPRESSVADCSAPVAAIAPEAE